MKVLVIEDQAEIRDTLKDMLEINGHEVLAAEDGVEGLRLVALHPDLIFCDMAMPNLDGPGVLMAVRRMPELSEVPFIFLTARAEREDQRKGMNMGADDYITKPFTEMEILQALSARHARHKGTREHLAELKAQHQREINAKWSHELLTPLNAVLGGLSLLESEEAILCRPELVEILSAMREGVERQEQLAGKLIRYFQLEQLREAPSTFQRRPSLADAEVRAGATKAAAEAGRTVDLVLDVTPSRVALLGDFLQHAVYEVVQNAFHFSATGSPVIVEGAPQGAVYRLEIMDEGEGMSAEQRAHVAAFTQFNRQRREQQGLGIGLAIVRLTMQVCGGSLFIEEGPKGKGLRVSLQVPLDASTA
jgi:CheY-like chemotaxis protein